MILKSLTMIHYNFLKFNVKHNYIYKANKDNDDSYYVESKIFF